MGAGDEKEVRGAAGGGVAGKERAGYLPPERKRPACLKWHTATEEEAGQPEMGSSEEEASRLPEVVPGKKYYDWQIGIGAGGSRETFCFAFFV